MFSGFYLIYLPFFFVCSAYDCVVPARGKAVVKTDLAIAIPWGTYARIGNNAVVFKRI